MSDYLLDCNHLSEAIRKVSFVRDSILSHRKSGVRFVTCMPVICELEVGILQTAAPTEYRDRLLRLLRYVKIRPMEMGTAREYGVIYQELRSKGRSLSQTDMILAAMARQHRLRLITSDRDFEALPDIVAENWIRA